MGLVNFFFFKVIPALGLGLFISLRLGTQLPVATRNTGRAFGMIYNYLKITLNALKPKNNDPGDLLKMARSISQQSLAFTREFQGNLLSTKSDLGELIPAVNYNPEKESKKEEIITLETPIKEKTDSNYLY